MSESEDLKRRAQEKLAEARRLIDEAGELAKRGQFFLHFGEIGDFIPRSAMSREGYRKQALEIAMKDGMTTRDATYDWNNIQRDAEGNLIPLAPREFIPWDDLEEEEREQLVDDITDSLWEDSPVPYEFREYASEDDADCWWHPSRC